MRMTKRLGGGVALAALMLASCSDGGSDSGGPGPGPDAGAMRLEDDFGLGFGRLFRAQANTDATEPQASDLTTLSFTTDPVAVP